MVVDRGPIPSMHAGLREGAPSDRRRWIVLAWLILLILGARLPTYREPLERDITTYAVIGHELLGGRALYSDLWDNKPPLVPLTYAAAEVVAGYGANAILLLGVGAASLTLLGVYRAVALATGDTAAALWGSAFWAAISADQTLQANQPNLEAFVNVCMVWSVVLVLRLGSAAASHRRAVMLGVLAALASLYKPVALPVLVLLGGGHVAVPGAATSRRAACRDLAIATCVFAAVWSCVAGYFVVAGRGDAFYWSVVAYNQEYAGSVVANLWNGLTSTRLFPVWFWFALPLVVLSLLAVIAGVRAGRARFAMIWLAYACGTAAAVALPGYFWPHYYQLWLPVLAIGGGAGVACLDAIIPRFAPWAGRLAASIAFGVLVAHELPFYAQSADEWSRNKYDSAVFIEAREVARTLDALLAPGETFFEWGSETGLYYLTRRSPPSGVFYIYPVIVESSFVPMFTARVIGDLERTKPELLVICRDYVYPGVAIHPLAQWLDPRYRLWAEAPTPENFRLYVRAGGQLEARLKEQGRL